MDIQVFENSEFGKVRTVTVEKEPWFVGKDVAEILGYAKPENALAAHVDSEDKTTTLIQGDGSNYKSKTTIINESGLYALILSSKLPTAKAFKRWVTSEVLPSIRKTGNYFVDNPEAPDTITGIPIERLMFRPYAYIDKTYRGQPMLTLIDIEHMTELTNTTIINYLKNHCKEWKDWLLVRNGVEIRNFMRENPKFRDSLTGNVSRLILVTQSGFEKVCAHYGIEIKYPSTFTLMVKPASEKSLKKSAEKPNKFKTERELHEEATEKTVSDCVSALGVLGVIRQRLTETGHTDGVDAINKTIQQVSWHMSRCRMGR